MFIQIKFASIILKPYQRISITLEVIWFDIVHLSRKTLYHYIQLFVMEFLHRVQWMNSSFLLLFSYFRLRSYMKANISCFNGRLLTFTLIISSNMEVEIFKVIKFFSIMSEWNWIKKNFMVYIHHLKNLSNLFLNWKQFDPLLNFQVNIDSHR